jgi:hypothetical protein
MKEKLSNLVRDPSIEKLELSLKTPNFFNILKISQNEIRHSNFLAWLLTPNDSHNLNSLFLKWFLKEIFSSEIITWTNEFSIDSTELNNIIIHREWKNIDLLIEHEDFVIAIENKVKSSEHSNQLNRYLNKINEAFPEKNKGFVFLTLDGISPENEEDQKDYVPIGYETIKSSIEIVLDVYKDSLSDRVKLYIEDYLLILNREVMKEDKSIDLARELYKNHKDAIDFIIENKPDRYSEIREIIEKTITSHGYILESCNKYYARFLTTKLSNHLPKTGYNGWKGNESLLFEMVYWEKSISLKFVIAPGNEQNRTLIGNIIKKLPKSKKAAGKKWLSYYSDPRRINFFIDKYNDPDKITSLVTKLLNDNKGNIDFVESEILNNIDEFEK